MSRSNRNKPYFYLAMKNGDVHHGCNGSDCLLDSNPKSRELVSSDGRCYKYAYNIGSEGQRRYYSAQINDWGYRKNSLRKERYKGKNKRMKYNRKSEDLSSYGRMQPHLHQQE